MTIWHRIVVISLICVSCVGCDQSTKSMASQYLPKSGMDSYLYDLVRLGYTENIGAFLGMGSYLPEQHRFIIFTVIAGGFLSALLLYLVFSKRLSILSLVALSLVFAGGISNFFDRATNNGAVVDFLNIGLGSVRTGIFNVADMAILFGCILFISAQKTQHKHQDL